MAALATTVAGFSAADQAHGSEGAALGSVRLWLRVESLLLLGAALVLYRHLGCGWERFFVLFLVPDVSFVGYLGGARVGAVAYNAAHALVGPLALAVAGMWLPALLPYALIWLAHVGFDRALGYGLKYERGFGATHLGHLHAARGR